jgi:hypothetical protein
MMNKFVYQLDKRNICDNLVKSHKYQFVMTADGFEQVKKLMKIIAKSDNRGKRKTAFVITDVSEYLDFSGNELVAGSETELIEKINKDITIWKSKQKEKELKQMEKELKRKDREIEIVADSAII